MLETKNLTYIYIYFTDLLSFLCAIVAKDKAHAERVQQGEKQIQKRVRELEGEQWFWWIPLCTKR